MKKYDKEDIFNFLRYAFNEDEKFFESLEETFKNWNKDGDFI